MTGQSVFQTITAAIISVLLSTLVLGPREASAQSDEVATRTLEVVEILNGSSWLQVQEGLRTIQARTESGITVTALEFSLDHFSISPGIQEEETGERADGIGKRTGAFFVVNAGFFREDDENRLAPVGLFSRDGNKQGKRWHNDGGYLVMDGLPSIRPTRLGEPGNSRNFIQTKPVLIEPGRKWAMNTNQGIQKRRTLVCLPENNAVIIVLVSGDGMSLFESGWLLRSKQLGGYFDCDSAIAMDGGGSTQSWMAGHKEYSLRGGTRVHNFLLFSAK